MLGPNGNHVDPVDVIAGFDMNDYVLYLNLFNLVLYYILTLSYLRFNFVLLTLLYGPPSEL